jgi:predicted DsbA family dithiol-disulfide isomerase
VKVEIYSDIACPWCYVGKRRFERALAAFPQADSVEVIYRPYQLVPGKSDQPEPHRAYLTARYGPQAEAMDARLVELGRAEGLPFDFDTVLENNTLLAHRLLWHALTAYGPTVQAALKDRLLTAHFAEGVDVGDRAALAALAADAGLDADRAAAFLASDEGHDEVLAEIDSARELGITAVPTFVFEGQWAVQGGQESSTFLSVLEQVAKETGAAAPAAAEACDADGACEVPAAG